MTTYSVFFLVILDIDLVEFAGLAVTICGTVAALTCVVTQVTGGFRGFDVVVAWTLLYAFFFFPVVATLYAVPARIGAITNLTLRMTRLTHLKADSLICKQVFNFENRR